MNEIVVKDEFKVAEIMHDIWMEVESVACIADYYTIKNVLSSLIVLSEGELKLNEIDLHEDMDEEYLLVLDDLGLWVYYMEVNDRYMPYHHDVVLIDNDCNSKVITVNENKECHFIFFSREDEECCCNCNRCEEECEENMRGFNFTHTDGKGTSSYSFYSSDYELVEKTRQELTKFLNKKVEL